MLTWVLGYLLIGVFIFWLCAAVFGSNYDVPVSWQVVAIALWPLTFVAAGYRTIRHHPIDEIAMEQALHRRESRSALRRIAPASQRNAEWSSTRTMRS
jgi:hypothetical protein